MTRYRSIQVVTTCALSGLIVHGAIQLFRSAPVETASADTTARAAATTDSGARGAEPPLPRRYIDAILGRPLFPVMPETASSPDSAQPGVQGVRIEGGLSLSRKLSLIGTVQREHGSGVAIVEDLTSKKQSLFRLRERVFQIGELADIQDERILIREGRQEEWLQSTSPRLDATAPAAPRATPPRGAR